MRQLDPALWPGHEALLEVPSRTALLAAAQMNVIEFHTWNSTVAKIDHPDRMVFDLDPGEGLAWAKVREGAALVRALLEQLGLRSWLKTSGGKGLHVVVPLAPRWTADLVKDFSQAVVQHLARSHPDTLRRAKRAKQPGRQDLRRLPAQWRGCNHRGRLLGARAARPGRVDAAGLGRARRRRQRRAMDRRRTRPSTCRGGAPIRGSTMRRHASR